MNQGQPGLHSETLLHRKYRWTDRRRTEVGEEEENGENEGKEEGKKMGEGKGPNAVTLLDWPCPTVGGKLVHREDLHHPLHVLSPQQCHLQPNGL